MNKRNDETIKFLNEVRTIIKEVHTEDLNKYFDILIENVKKASFENVDVALKFIRALRDYEKQQRVEEL